MLQLRKSLIRAMNLGKCVQFQYDGKQRIVEVHAVGTSTSDGEPVMRGFQVAGVASRPLPQWTLFRIEKIFDLVETDRDSNAPEEGYTMNDSHMATIEGQIQL